MTERVRAIATTDDGCLVTIKRIRPGAEPYWMLPGGGIEPGDGPAGAALFRELGEELGATADIGPRVVSIGHEHFYLARLYSYDVSHRHGPEFSDSARGQHLLDLIPQTLTGLSAIALLPAAVAHLLAVTIRAGKPSAALSSARPAITHPITHQVAGSLTRPPGP